MNTENNNTLGLNSDVISAILTIADNLRANYQKIGVDAHQMPRNPYPAHKLVINTLPTRASKAMDANEISAALKKQGYTVSYFYLAAILSKLFKTGAIARSGERKHYRYWFAF